MPAHTNTTEPMSAETEKRPKGVTVATHKSLGVRVTTSSPHVMSNSAETYVELHGDQFEQTRIFLNSGGDAYSHAAAIELGPGCGLAFTIFGNWEADALANVIAAAMSGVSLNDNIDVEFTPSSTDD